MSFPISNLPFLAQKQIFDHCATDDASVLSLTSQRVKKACNFQQKMESDLESNFCNPNDSPMAFDNNLYVSFEYQRYLDGIQRTERKECHTSQNPHRAILQKTLDDLREVLTWLIPDCKVIAVGSFAAELDTYASDIDISLIAPSVEKDVLDNGTYSKEEKKNPRIFKILCLETILRWLKDERMATYHKEADWWNNCILFENSQIIEGKIPVLSIRDRWTGVQIDITYNNKKAVLNTKFLYWLGELNPKFRSVARLIKTWAHEYEVENSKHHRLNPFSICLLTIAFLQQNHALPTSFDLFKELREASKADDETRYLRNYIRNLDWKNKCTMTISEMFVAFLKFFREFDFNECYVDVSKGGKLRKTASQTFKINISGSIRDAPMVILDPEYPGLNCARTVLKNCDRATMQEKAAATLEDFESPKLEFSFRRSKVRIVLCERGEDVLLTTEFMGVKQKHELEKEKGRFFGAPYDIPTLPYTDYPEVSKIEDKEVLVPDSFWDCDFMY